LRRREDVPDAEVILDHVAPFAGRQLPERRDHDSFELPVPAAVDHRIATMKHLYIFFDH
jgi:hypothetical protein